MIKSQNLLTLTSYSSVGLATNQNPEFINITLFNLYNQPSYDF